MEALDALIRAAVAGDQAAWTELADQILPRIHAIIGSHQALRSRGLAKLQDDVAEVTTATLERLSRDGMRNLIRYLAQRDEPEVKRPQSFDAWLYGAVDYTIRDHLRKRYGRAPKSVVGVPPEAAPSKRDLGTGHGVLDEERHRDSMVRAIGLTTQLTLMEIFAYADATFDPKEARALRLHYVDERGFAEIANELELADATAAERLVRKLNARLRYRFATPP